MLYTILLFRALLVWMVISIWNFILSVDIVKHNVEKKQHFFAIRLF